jgi:uncharacterized protein
MHCLEKYQQLQSLLKNYSGVAVAFSGGVDSTLLLKVASDVLGAERVLAITAVSPLFPASEKTLGCQITAQLNVRHHFIESPHLEPQALVDNGPLRCYYCKKHIFQQCLEVQQKEGFNILIEGSNSDDLDDYRPGRKALEELQIYSPLLECHFTKAQVRSLSHHLGLNNWNKPATACLASRVPYGTPLTRDLLRRISDCEDWLHQQGFSQCRVRSDQQLARIEIEPKLFSKFLEPDRQRELLNFFKKNGFDYITLDLQGYRRGSMNETLIKEEKD